MISANGGGKVATKLSLLVLLAVGIAVVVITALGVFTEYRKVHNEVRVLLESHAQVIGSNNTAAIVFDEPFSARESLQSLNTVSGIELAVVYRANNERFASYQRSDNKESLPDLRERGYYFEHGNVDYYVDIQLDGDRIGTLFLRYDMEPIYADMRKAVLSELGLGLVAVLVAMFFVHRLQKTITKPIQELAAASQKVSIDGDYSVRVRPRSDDEIGRLTTVFNEMLQVVQDRDRELARSRDLLEQRVAERTSELLVAKEQAEEAARSKSQFLAAMSHEIRTPLNGVIGMASLLSGTELNDEQRDSISTIQSSADALLAIINDILDFSKIEAGKMELELIGFNLREVMEELVELMKLKASEKGIYLQLGILPGTPERVVGDPGRIRQVLMNFIGNAIKFTHQGGVMVMVSANTVGPSRAHFRLSVQDTGIGIAAHNLEHIFDEFTQADRSTTRKYGGTGLGLSISLLLARLMGGEIGVESHEGHGSDFWLSLDMMTEPVIGADETQVLRGRQALVVGDITGKHRLTSEWCRSWGMDVAHVDSVAEALTLCIDQARRFDVVLVDDVIGLSVCQKLAVQLARAEQHPACLVLLTSTALPDAGALAQSAGYNAYFSRPIKERMLRMALEKLLQGGEPAGHEFINAFSFAPRTMTVVRESSEQFRVLLAEDNAVNQKVAVRMLQKLGCSVDIAENGREAVRMWKQYPYDLILMDCHMPIMDGYEAAAEIRRNEHNNQRSPIVALTANAMESEQQACYDAGMDGFVAKPVKITELEKVIFRYARSENASIHNIDG